MCQVKEVIMRRILENHLLNFYIEKHNIENIFDKNILKHAELHFYERGEQILQAESFLEYYYLLVDGKVKVTYLFENGKSMLLKFYKDFNTLGDLELLKNKPVRCNVEAIKDIYLIAMPSNILRNEYMDNLNFLHHLIHSLSEKLEATINNSSYNYVYPLVNRFASYLVEHLTNKEYVTLNSTFLEISEFLGTTYRHLNRTIKDLEAKEIINCKNKTINILDEKRLRELARISFIETPKG